MPETAINEDCQPHAVEDKIWPAKNILRMHPPTSQPSLDEAGTKTPLCGLVTPRANGRHNMRAVGRIDLGHSQPSQDSLAGIASSLKSSVFE